MAENFTTKKIKVFGRVQGVMFRYFARREAVKLALNGYAKNLEDGSVKIIVQGKKSAVEKFIEWARKGPFLAKVEIIEVEELSSARLFNGFETI